MLQAFKFNFPAASPKNNNPGFHIPMRFFRFPYVGGGSSEQAAEKLFKYN